MATWVLESALNLLRGKDFTILEYDVSDEEDGTYGWTVTQNGQIVLARKDYQSSSVFVTTEDPLKCCIINAKGDVHIAEKRSESTYDFLIDPLDFCTIS